MKFIYPIILVSLFESTCFSSNHCMINQQEKYHFAIRSIFAVTNDINSKNTEISERFLKTIECIDTISLKNNLGIDKEEAANIIESICNALESFRGPVNQSVNTNPMIKMAESYKSLQRLFTNEHVHFLPPSEAAHSHPNEAFDPSETLPIKDGYEDFNSGVFKSSMMFYMVGLTICLSRFHDKLKEVHDFNEKLQIFPPLYFLISDQNLKVFFNVVRSVMDQTNALNNRRIDYSQSIFEKSLQAHSEQMITYENFLECHNEIHCILNHISKSLKISFLKQTLSISAPIFIVSGLFSLTEDTSSIIQTTSFLFIGTLSLSLFNLREYQSQMHKIKIIQDFYQTKKVRLEETLDLIFLFNSLGTLLEQELSQMNKRPHPLKTPRTTDLANESAIPLNAPS